MILSSAGELNAPCVAPVTCVLRSYAYDQREETLLGEEKEERRAKALKREEKEESEAIATLESHATKEAHIMNWFVVAVVILFFTVAILTSDYWLDRFFGTKPIDSWDETQKWNDMRQRLEPEIQKETGGLDYLEYYDFRRKPDESA
jgi:hypothetical protein